MHQKKSEVQIGKESTGISSDFNHHLLSSIHQKHHQTQNQNQIFLSITPFSSSSSSSSSTTPYKRPSLSKSQTLYKFFPPTTKTAKFSKPHFTTITSFYSLSTTVLRRLRHRIRLILLISLPFSYFLVSNPTQSFFLNFLTAAFFSAALLFSLKLKLPPLLRVVAWRRNKSKSKVLVHVASGVTVFANGDVYEGEFCGGKCEGSGVYYYNMSGRYEGDWVDGKYDGFGVESWAKGSRYRGQYRQGLRHGFGVYRFYTGDVYAGQWLNGQSHGCGVHTCDDGSKYVGEFKWGVKHGLGHYHFRNGDTYAGEYFADKMHGFGVYCFANGHRYEGSWHEGKRQGLGMYTFRNGETQSGHWKNGVLDIPSTQNFTYPVSPIGVNHSKVLNAVQEARRAAKKAYDVARVDERVNRAVAAANRAANAARVAAVKAVQKQMHHHVNSESIPISVV